MVSGIAIPPPKVPPIGLILYGREAPMVSGIAIPPSEFPPPLRECFLRSVPVREAEVSTVVSEVELVKEGEVSPPIEMAESGGNGANGKPSAPLPG